MEAHRCPWHHSSTWHLARRSHQVVLEPAAYLVEGAGVEIVNGRYFKSSRRMNDATAFTNNRGIMLFLSSREHRLSVFFSGFA